MRRYFIFLKHDYLVLICTVFPFMMIVCYLIMGDQYFRWPVFLLATVNALIIGTLSWVMHIVTANIMQELIPSHTKIVNRIMIQLPVYILLTQAVICFGTFAALHALGLAVGMMTWQTYRPIFFAGLLLNVIATSFHEGVMFFNKWRLSLVETEQLKKMNLQSQLDSLKNQVNPHFLFNSLNCLSSLIGSDPDKAQEFLDEMSKVYRYLLRSNENELIPLLNELQFVDSFFHMLKTRYGDGIELKVEVADQHLNYLIPPLTLQILIENAIKHNTILKVRPLQIRIDSEGKDMLKVSNNIQKKMSAVLSNKIGLQNIVAKYQLLNYNTITIDHGDKVFSVTLPLIKNI